MKLTMKVTIKYVTWLFYKLLISFFSILELDISKKNEHLINQAYHLRIYYYSII